MTRFLLALVGATLFATAPTPRYSIQAIRYATEPDIPVSAMAVGAPKDQKVDAADVIWLIRGGDRNILLDSGCHRDTFLKESPMKDYLRPDLAVEAAYRYTATRYLFTCACSGRVRSAYWLQYVRCHRIKPRLVLRTFYHSNCRA